VQLVCICYLPTAGEGGRASGVVAVVEPRVISQRGVRGKRIRILSGQGPGSIVKSRDANQSKALRIVAWLVLPYKKPGRVRKDKGFGLAAERGRGENRTQSGLQAR
jgi:hypothetical protein